MTVVDERTRRIAALFDELAPSYETVVPWYAPIAERLVDTLDPHHREHVLDAGCGTGVAIPALAEAVGPHGRVVGVDLSRRMLDRAKLTVAHRGLHNVELYEMDACHPDLPPSSFNAVIASQVLFLLPDPPAALRAWHDLLLPMGKVGITTFAERTPVWDEVDQLFRSYLLNEDARPAPPATSGSDRVISDLVVDAGFQDVRTTRFDLPVTFRDAEQWRDWSMSVGQRATWALIPDEDRDDIYRRAASLLERRGGAGRPVELVQTVRMTIGYRRY